MRILWDSDRTSGPFVVSPVGVAVRGTARTLRTTQWTRASCSRLSSWLHKMILKIISQFQSKLFREFGVDSDSNSCDFKSLRANGGCLGIWSRRRT